MAIRVTQQYVDVLGAGSGMLRVSRQYIEVLHAPGSATVTGNATSAISMVSAAHGFVENQSANSSLGVTDAAIAARAFGASASSTITMSDGILKTSTVVASTVMSLLSVESHFNYVADRNVVEQSLGLTQLASTSDSRSGSHTLSLIQSVDVRGPVFVLANNQLFLVDTPRSLNKYASASSTLVMSIVTGVPIDLTVNQSLGITDVATMSFVVHVMALTQLAEGGRSPGVQRHTMVLTQVVKTNGTFRRTLLEDIGVGHSLTYFEDTPCNRKEYSPFMGDNTVPNAKEAPASSIPNPQADTSASDPCDPQRFLLYYPARGARSTEIGIRAPEFGNRDRNAYTRINRETRGGKLVVYADTDWPQIRTMLVTFIALPKSAIDSIQTLFKNRLGQLIGITDWEGHEWEGVITDPEEPVTQDGKRGWTMTFSFEGQIIDGHSPGNAIAMAVTSETGKDPGANSALTMSDEVGGADAVGGQGQNMDIMQAASAVVV